MSNTKDALLNDIKSLPENLQTLIRELMGYDKVEVPLDTTKGLYHDFFYIPSDEDDESEQEQEWNIGDAVIMNSGGVVLTIEDAYETEDGRYGVTVCGYHGGTFIRQDYVVGTFRSATPAEVVESASRFG